MATVSRSKRNRRGRTSTRQRCRDRSCRPPWRRLAALRCARSRIVASRAPTATATSCALRPVKKKLPSRASRKGFPASPPVRRAPPRRHRLDLAMIEKRGREPFPRGLKSIWLSTSRGTRLLVGPSVQRLRIRVDPAIFRQPFRVRLCDAQYLSAAARISESSLGRGGSGSRFR